MRPGLAAFFDPRAVAVVGASADPSKVGGSVLANLRASGYGGRVVPINSTRSTVQGLPAVPTVLDVEGPLDVVVVAVPADRVLPVLEQCATKGVAGAVVISAGFQESGAEGRAREAALRAWLRGRPLRVIGPNCLGWIRPCRHLNLTFAAGTPAPGALGFFSHSGALGTAILDWSREHNLGFSVFASLGNQADVNETDLLTALADDPETRVILGYLEGVAEGRAFFTALRAAAARKPCVLLKAGRSAEGARAVSSHTGALAGSDRAFDAAVRQAGALRVHTLEEMFDVARALVTGRIPPGRRVVIVTNGGGLGILATDAARDAGLAVTPSAPAVQAALREALPPHAAVGNPIDLIGDATPSRYGAALHALAAEPDSLIVMVSPQAATDAAGVARAILGGTRGWRAPVLAVLAGGARIRPGVAALEEGGVPCYPFPERAVRALSQVIVLGSRRRTPAMCASPVPVDAAALTAAHAAAVAADMLGRVAAARPSARLDGVLVQPMATGGGAELLLGMVRDPQFGPLITVGFGGIFVEILGDVATRLAPVDRLEARAMLDELRMAPALHGARGRSPVNLDGLADVVARFSALAAGMPELVELEINPLLVDASGSRALDVRGRVDTNPPASSAW